MSDKVLVELQGPTLLITLNRPDKRNAFTNSMLESWADALTRAQGDVTVSNVVVTGAGVAFCAGADLRAYDTDTGASVSNPVSLSVHSMALAARALDKPYIAAINGAAVGAGLGMALMADLRFFSDRARVSEGYINVGSFPGDGDTYYLPRIVGMSRALMMLWSGEMLDADECFRTGLADQVWPHDLLIQRTLEFATRLAARPDVLVRAIKRAAYSNRDMSLNDSLNMITGLSAVVSARQSPQGR